MVEVFVPRENVNDESVTILKVYFESGQLVKSGDVIVDVETSKTNVEICSPESGLLTHNLVSGYEVDVGSVIFKVGSDKDLHCASSTNDSNIIPVDKFSEHTRLLSKAAHFELNKLGVDVSKLPYGWITSKDVSSVNKENLNINPNSSTGISSDVCTSINLKVESKKIKISRRKREEIAALRSGNHGETTSVIGITINAFGRRFVEQHPLFVDSISDIIVYEAARLLKKFKSLNSSYINDNEYAVYDHVNVGWSFDNGNNLKVLAIQDANCLSLAELQNEVMKLLDLYESNETIPMDLLTKSTVTITDLSRLETSFVLPLINGFQSLIISITKDSPNIFKLFASFDHRLTSGLEVTQFLGELKSRVLAHFNLNDLQKFLTCSICDKTMLEEIELGSRGFLKVLMADGVERHLCRNCYEGW